MPTQQECYRIMLTRLRNAFAHAHPTGMASRHAHIVCGMPSHMPSQPERDRAMLTRVRNVIMQRAVPPNRRLQLTAFGARDRWYFSPF